VKTPRRQRTIAHATFHVGSMLFGLLHNIGELITFLTARDAASRSRIADAGDQARRRIERDLHDGT
jgi:hypothetical protein